MTTHGWPNPTRDGDRVAFARSDTLAPRQLFEPRSAVVGKTPVDIGCAHRELASERTRCGAIAAGSVQMPE
jgi:hypothetical protein